MKNSFILLFIASNFFSCQSPEDLKVEKQYQFERKIDTLQMENFKIPDSINTKLILASYYNNEYDIQTLLVYSDSTHEMVRKIDYLKDSTSDIDELMVLKRNEFRSSLYNVEYVIHENSVSMIHIRVGEGAIPRSKEYRRTDRD